MKAPRAPVQRPAAPQPAPATRPPGTSWLSGLLERASDDQAAFPATRGGRPAESASANRI